MDDDFGFEASVWDTPAEASTSQKLPPTFAAPSRQTDGFRDPFDGDEFDAPIQVLAQDDDFGDFGDFGDEMDAGESVGFGQTSPFNDEEPMYQPPTTDWDSLRLDPLPSNSKLKDDVEDLLEPLWGGLDASQFLNDDGIRQMEGLSQILVTPESRTLYNVLFHSSPPNIRPPNWIRSRIRRQHLTSLGIPVNLDEVLPQANGKALPALQITTRPSSAPPGPRNAAQASRAVPASGSNSRAGTPKPSTPSRTSSIAQLALGPKPELDGDRISRAMALSPDSLPLLPLTTLESHLASMRSLTASTSTLLTHLLQTRDALQQDAETYNGLIAELVGEAQKMKTGPKTRTGMGKRGSGMQ